MNKQPKHANTPKDIVDLSKAVKGQKLISCHGEILTFEGYCDRESFPYNVRYSDGSMGSRTKDGFTTDNLRLACDHDIVYIVPLENEVALKEFEEYEASQK